MKHIKRICIEDLIEQINELEIGYDLDSYSCELGFRNAREQIIEMLEKLAQ